ncbi:MAG: GNAT family N-acetyltransferase [Muribaculaceae bacterium]|nr:GNAT family N-acetyltransferase [Muribaculaceae bacterium]
MENIIPPVELTLIERELTQERFLRHTNKAGNEIYVVDAHNSPNIMREIGRLREISFRAGGGGTGKACDIDEFDLMEPACKQLFVWNPAEKEIIGAYRYIAGKDIRFTVTGEPRIATAHMFRFSENFLEHYLPKTLELGRSFVRPEYQSTRAGSKAIFALDNLWDGLGAVTVLHPEVEYLFGKATMYPTYDRESRNLLLCFLHMYFPDRESLVTPIEPLRTEQSMEELREFFAGDDFRKDYKRLNAFVRERGITIPPLVNAYMSLSPTMRMFGTAINHEFGEVEETGIFLKISEITDQKKSRHIDTYEKDSVL